MNHIQKQRNEFHIPITDDNLLAVDVLANVTGQSRTKIKKAMQQGCVWLEKPGKESQNSSIQRLRRAKKILKPGDTLHFYFDADLLNAISPEAEIVSDEGDYSIWNKPSGMFSQGSKWGDHCTIYRWAETHLQPQRPAFLVHRLDRAANGLMIIAHKKTIAAKFSRMFAENQIQKTYEARVSGNFSNKISKKGNKYITLDEPLDGKRAISIMELIEFDHTLNESLLRVKIHTGRKHQIRQHLAMAGYPIVGDRLYGDGAKVNNHTRDLRLSSVSLRFNCPLSGEEKSYQVKRRTFEMQNKL